MGFWDQFNTASNPIPQVQRQQPVQAPPITASPFGPQQPDEEVFVGAQDPSEELFTAFKNNVLNPPQRTQMTYPPNILAGLTKALDVARTPTDYEKNRVFVDGNAYQKARVFDDPATGKRHFIEPYKQPGFMENVMKAMPEAVSVAPAILNQKRADEMADWDLRNKGYAAAISADAQMQLGRQREAQADYLGQKPDIERDKIAVQRLTAQERVRVSQLKTLTDAQLEQMRISGRISLAEYNATQAMKRVEAQQAGATQRTQMTIEGNKALEKIRQTGRIELEDLRSLNDQELEELRQDGRLDLESRRHINREIEIRSRGEETRKTKTTPGASSANDASKYPTQDRVATQKRVSEVLAANPEWKKRNWITFDDNGFPLITSPEERNGPDEVEYRRMRDAVYPQKKGDVNLPAPITAPASSAPASPLPADIPSSLNLPGQAERDAKFPPKPVPVKPVTAPTPPATPKVNPPNVGGGRGANPGSASSGSPKTGTVRVKAPDGRTGTWDYSKGPIPNGFEVIK